VRSAVSDAAASLLAFVPSLGIREVFAFGEGVALPTRLRFKELPAHALPKSESIALVRVDSDSSIDRNFLTSVVERWRDATMSGRVKFDDPTELDAFRKEFGVGGDGVMSESEKYRLKALNAESGKVKPFAGQPGGRLRK
jgi:hypothetical protein